MLGDIPLGAAGTEKRTDDVIADMCFKCQEGFFATEHGAEEIRGE